MKAVLVIDEMPNQCIECPCYRQSQYKKLFEWCNVTDRQLTWQEVVRTPEWCPLKPLPKIKPMTKADSTYDPWEDTYRRGWNACLEALEDLQNGEDSNE